MPILSSFGAAKLISTGGSTPAPTTLLVSYLLVGGGGGSGAGANNLNCGAGGGGGWVIEVNNQSADFGVAYSVVVGEGGAGSTLGVAAQDGGYSGYRIGTNEVAFGGGKGGSSSPANSRNGGTKGSGGGGYGTGAGGASVYIAGFSGSNGYTDGSLRYQGAGGAGAGAKGNRFPTDGNNNGGSGITSSITGSAVVYGGGGAGNLGIGGAGGGGNGGDVGYAGQPGVTNTGGGAGGARVSNNTGFSGGRGIVIFRIPSTRVASFSAGVTFSVITTGGYKIYSVTQTSDESQTVTFS